MSVKTKISKLTKTLLLATSFCLLSPFLSAKEKDYKFNIYWSGPGQSSWHVVSKGEPQMEEENNIYGFGININDKLDVFLKHADKNSYGHPANFLGFNYKFICKEKFFDFCFGASGGLINGYEIVRKDKGFFPVIMPYLGVEKEIGYGKKLGVDINIPGQEFIWTFKIQTKF